MAFCRKGEDLSQYALRHSVRNLCGRRGEGGYIKQYLQSITIRQIKVPVPWEKDTTQKVNDRIEGICNSETEILKSAISKEHLLINQ